MKTRANGHSKLVQSTCDGRMAENRERLEYAKQSIETLANEVVRSARTGTIGVEIPVKDGKLGRVKWLLIEFQPD